MSASIWRYVLVAAMLFAFFIGIGDAFDRGRFGSTGIVYSPVSEREAVVTQVLSGSEAARAGVRAGDRIVAAWVRPTAVLHGAAANGMRAGTRVTFYDANLRRAIALTAIPVPGIFGPARILAHVLRVASFLLALFLFWRYPGDRAARVLGAVLVVMQLQNFGNTGSFAFGTHFSAYLGGLAYALIFPLLALFACWFPNRNPRDARYWLAVVTVALTAADIAMRLLAYGYAYSGRGLHVPAQVYQSISNWGEACVFGAFLIAAVVVDFRTSTALNRRRLEWLTVGIALQAYSAQFVLLPTLLTFGNGYNTTGLMLTDAANVLGAICLVYGFVRYRVLDITFVINRAAVFAVISTAIVVLFMSLEHLLSKYIEAQSHVTSAVITLSIALGIGLSMRAVHQRVDRLADSVVFRRRHHANELLRSFGREAAFITDEAVLRDRTLLALIECGGAESAALYETNDDGDYALTCERQVNGQRLIGANDPVVTLLKEKRVPVFVDSAKVSLHAELLFPMFVRGDLSGIVLCGKRRVRETYAPDEIEAMDNAIERAAVQMDALRTKRLQNQLSQVQELVRQYMTLEADGSRVLERIAEISGVQENSHAPYGVKHA